MALKSKFFYYLKNRGLLFTLKKTCRHLYRLLKSKVGEKIIVKISKYKKVSHIDECIKLATQKLTGSKEEYLIDSFLKSNNTDLRRIAIFPLSYPLELRQRPDHIFKIFSKHGFTTIIVSSDSSSELFIKKIEENVILTNMFFPSIVFFKSIASIVYVCNPIFGYFREVFKNSIFIYDVLDELSILGVSSSAMVLEHEKTKKESDIILFSSKALLESNTNKYPEKTFLVTNGVWESDFLLKDDSKKVDLYIKDKSRKNIGYYGVISDLLDWELLDKISDTPLFNLIFIGKIDEFSKGFNDSLRQKVLNKPNVYHVPVVSYFDLKYYLSQLDAAIVPFLVNQKTNSVSPLKLFEYIASNLVVFATPTRTLQEYSDCIFVGDSAKILKVMRAWAEGSCQVTKQGYRKILNEVDWEKQMKPVMNFCYNLLEKKSNLKKKVDFINVVFFDLNGEIAYKGGAERYIYDLACLCKKNGWEPRILQNANFRFSKLFKGIPVEGFCLGEIHDFVTCSKRIVEECSDADLVISSPLEMAYLAKHLNVIGINHGVYWDVPSKIKIEDSFTFQSLRNVNACVCVDTNFINWVRTTGLEFSAMLKYIPNYYDSEQFKPIDKYFEGNIQILYPRRAYFPRGIHLMLEAFDSLVPKYNNITLHIVGQADKEFSNLILKYIDKYPSKIIWEEFDMEDMHIPYQKSHIVVIPTVHSEGTSLSCIEAMATNNAVISSNVGGLPNLILNDFNGLLISPKVGELITAIEKLLENRDDMKRLATNALQVAPAFEKKKWEYEWSKILSSFLG